MVSWTSGKAGWAILSPDGRFLTGRGLCWEPEGAALFTSREKARQTCRKLPKGCRVVQLISVEQWHRKYDRTGSQAA
jgi:hypothetical protein